MLERAHAGIVDIQINFGHLISNGFPVYNYHSETRKNMNVNTNTKFSIFICCYVGSF